MNNDDRVNDLESETTSSPPPTDTSGRPVDVVERELEDSESDTEGVDQTITSPSTQTKEQEAEEHSRKIAEIERKVADGN